MKPSPRLIPLHEDGLPLPAPACLSSSDQKVHVLEEVDMEQESTDFHYVTSTNTFVGYSK